MSYTAFGHYNQAKAGHPEGYYSERHSMMDYRGNMKISPLSYWGWANTVITASHEMLGGEFTGVMVLKPVVVEEYAWITSRCVLYNCTIKHHAIVSIGSVVCGMVIEPYTVVQGNPAVVIAQFDQEIKKWRKVHSNIIMSNFTLPAGEENFL